MRGLLGIAMCGLLLAAAPACSGSPPKASAERTAARTCPAAVRAGWQRLANRIHAPVYCPAWMPDPLDGRIGGRWNTIHSVARDRSYLIGFIWAEPGSGELHVNLRGYPGVTRIPTCVNVTVGVTKTHRSKIPCFADPHGRVRVGAIDATVYTANQDADLWHVLYAWRYRGSLYTLSQHVAAPLTYSKVIADLNRMLRSLVLVAPR